MSLVYLEWADAINNHSNNWNTKEMVLEWAKQSDWSIRECGWLIEETKEYIVLAGSWKPEDDWTEEQFSLLKKIPKPWILKRVNLSKHIK